MKGREAVGVEVGYVFCGSLFVIQRIRLLALALGNVGICDDNTIGYVLAVAFVDTRQHGGLI